MENRTFFSGNLRASTTGKMKVTGKIPYGKEAEGLPFREKLRRGCFRDALHDSRNIYCLLGHDHRQPLGNRSGGSLVFRDTPDALEYDVFLDPNNPIHVGFHNAVGRGDFPGSSFGFEMPMDGSGEMWDGGIREIIRVERLLEVSPCVFPAYEESSLNARSRAGSEKNKMKYTISDIQNELEIIERNFNIPKEERTGNQQIELNKAVGRYDKHAQEVDKDFPLCEDIGIRGVIEHMSQTGTEYRTNPADQADGQRFQVGRNRSNQYRSFGHFLQDVATSGMSDNRPSQRLVEHEREMRAASGMSEGVLSDGGFLVAPEFSQELLHDAMKTGVLASRCKQVPMTRHKLTLPGVDETSRANGSRMGGVQAYWENEADAITATKPKFRQINLAAKKLTGLVYMTDELLEDAPACESWVKSGFSDEFGFKLDDAIIRGTGAGEPLGILNAGCLITQDKEDGQASSTIVANNVMKMFERLISRSTRNARWYINQACWNQIFSLHLEIGTAGVPLFIEPGKLKDAPYGAILGRPVEPLEQCEALGTVGDILFADFSQYVLGMKNGMKTDSSMHVKFTTDEMAFRFILRVDGQPIRASALTPYKGSDDQSSFVVLQSR